MRLTAWFSANSGSVPHVSSLVAEQEGWLADFLRRELCERCSVNFNHVDYAAVLDVILKASQKTCLGLEPSSVLDQRQQHLKSTCPIHFINRFRKLKAVSNRSSDQCPHIEEVRILFCMGCIVIIYWYTPGCSCTLSIMKQQLPVQNVNDLYQLLEDSWKVVAVWLVKSGPHNAGISGTNAGPVQEVIKGRTLPARFALMSHIIITG